MTAIVCIDNREHRGLSLKGKRLHKDPFIIAQIMSVCEGHRLLMSPYSYQLFEPMAENGWARGPKTILVAEDYAASAGRADYCFVEQIPAQMPDVHKVIVYSWNREHEADVIIPDFFSNPFWVQRSRRNIQGMYGKVTEYVLDRALPRRQQQNREDQIL